MNACLLKSFLEVVLQLFNIGMTIIGVEIIYLISVNISTYSQNNDSSST